MKFLLPILILLRMKYLAIFLLVSICIAQPMPPKVFTKATSTKGGATSLLPSNKSHSGGLFANYNYVTLLWDYIPHSDPRAIAVDPYWNYRGNNAFIVFGTTNFTSWIKITNVVEVDHVTIPVLYDRMFFSVVQIFEDFREEWENEQLTYPK